MITRFLRKLFLYSAFLALLIPTFSGCQRPTPSVSSPPFSSKPAEQIGISSGIHFVDVAQRAGLNYRWEIPGKRPLTILQTIGNGCAFLDYDNDGNLDILLVGSRLALYKGDGKGHFAEVTHTVGLDALSGHYLGCAVGDYDNDGYDDIYISGYQTGLLLHNEAGKGKDDGEQGANPSLAGVTSRVFRDMTLQAGLKPQPWGTSCAFGDVDGDGKLDLYICNYLEFRPDTVPQLCTTLGHLTACSPLFYKPEKGVLYHNLGNGRFQDATRLWKADSVSGKALGVAFAPADATRPQSLAIANDEEAGDLLVTNRNRFHNIGPEAGIAYSAAGKAYGGMGLDWGDYNNDGRLDLTVAAFADEAKPIYRNNGSTFEDQSQALGVADPTHAYVAFGIKWLDIDNDGWLDLILSNGHISDNVADFDATHSYRQPTQLLHNLAGGRFEDMGARAGMDLTRPLVGRGLAIGDFDNDGRLDVLVVDSEGAPLLLHNETTPSGHWLLVKLVGTRSNRDGMGALVTAETGDRKLVRHCHTDGSYLSASDRRVHFGLGQATTTTLTVHWPDKHIDHYANVSVDREITLQEGTQKVVSGKGGR